MSDPFAAYAKQAHTHVNAPAKLVGTMKLRSEARLRFGEIVFEMNQRHTSQALEQYLQSIRGDLTQYAAELEFLWSGDDEFIGLEREIERARARVDDGLDYPRWEARNPKQEY